MKKILLFTAIITLLSININVQAADCSNYKTFSHKWNLCKIGKLPGIGEAGAEAESNKSKGSGTIKGFWNKIKTFGGSEIGSEG